MNRKTQISHLSVEEVIIQLLKNNCKVLLCTFRIHYNLCFLKKQCFKSFFFKIRWGLEWIKKYSQLAYSWPMFPVLRSRKHKGQHHSLILQEKRNKIWVIHVVLVMPGRPNVTVYPINYLAQEDLCCTLQINKKHYSVTDISYNFFFKSLLCQLYCFISKKFDIGGFCLLCSVVISLCPNDTHSSMRTCFGTSKLG